MPKTKGRHNISCPRIHALKDPIRPVTVQQFNLSPMPQLRQIQEFALRFSFAALSVVIKAKLHANHPFSEDSMRKRDIFSPVLRPFNFEQRMVGNIAFYVSEDGIFH